MKTFFANTAAFTTLLVAGTLTVQTLSAQEAHPNKVVVEVERPSPQTLTLQAVPPSATGKIRAFFASEQSKNNTSQWNLDIETLKSIAPELVQARTEYTGTPHARMPHFRTEKTVYSIDNTAFTQLLAKAILEQQSEIERLRNEVVLMKAQSVK